MYNCPTRWYTVVDEMSVDEVLYTRNVRRRIVVEPIYKYIYIYIVSYNIYIYIHIYIHTTYINFECIELPLNII